MLADCASEGIEEKEFYSCASGNTCDAELDGLEKAFTAGTSLAQSLVQRQQSMIADALKNPHTNKDMMQEIVEECDGYLKWKCPPGRSDDAVNYIKRLSYEVRTRRRRMVDQVEKVEPLDAPSSVFVLSDGKIQCPTNCGASDDFQTHGKPADEVQGLEKAFQKGFSFKKVDVMGPLMAKLKSIQDLHEAADQSTHSDPPWNDPAAKYKIYNTIHAVKFLHSFATSLKSVVTDGTVPDPPFAP